MLRKTLSTIVEICRKVKKFCIHVYFKYNRLLKYIYLGFGYFIWICIFVSIFIELLNGGSIFYTITKREVNISSFLNLEAIGEVCETIGLSSILIVWLYSSFDKVELGLKYITILKFQHKYYFAYTLSHIASILIGIWASKTSALEIGLLSLAAVVWGCVMHCVFICKLLFNPMLRRVISSAIWRERIDTTENVVFLKHIYSLIETIDVREDIDTERACELVAEAMSKLPNKQGSLDEDKLLCQYESIWNNLLGRHDSEKRVIITKLIFSKLQNNDYVAYVCAGYILWLYKYALNNSICDNSEERALTHVILHLDGLNYKSDKELSQINEFLYMFGYNLMWLVFFGKKASLNSNLLKRSNNFSCKDSENKIEYITTFARCLNIFDETKNESERIKNLVQMLCKKADEK